MGPPSVQATYMKQFAERIRLLGQAGQDVIAKDPALFHEIDASGRMAWLPVELNVRMIEALYDALGPMRAHEFQSDQITSQFSTPLWRSFVEGGVRLMGLDPAVLTRWIPRALGLIFKSCGIWTVERESETSALLKVQRLPASLAFHPQWLDSVSGGLHALFILCRTSGETRISAVDPDRGTATIELRWKTALD